MVDQLKSPEAVRQQLKSGRLLSAEGEDDGQTQFVTLEREPVELYKILKFEGLADSGAQAKHLIDEGQVLVNGEVELRRRRKIVNLDVIQLDQLTLNIVVGPHE